MVSVPAARHCATACLLLAACFGWLLPLGAQQYKLTGETLFLGNADTDQAKARAAVQAARDHRAEWEVSTSAGAYSSAGGADENVRDGLTQYARYLADAPRLDRLAAVPPLREGARAALAKATTESAKDPLVGCVVLVLETPVPNDMPRRAADAAKLLEKSAYPPAWKFRAHLRAAELSGREVVRIAAVTGRPAAPPPGTDYQGSLDKSRGNLVALLRDPATPTDAAAQAVDSFLRTARAVPTAAGDRACAELGKAFDAPDWTGPAGGSAVMSTAAGVFWAGYAWRGNEDFYDGMVRDARWKPFQERLAKAEAALENAWKLDPGNARAAVGMLVVERGQHQSRERLETWFRRAMDADPDSFDACVEKLNYIQPRWFGDARQAVEFGHQCQATRNWVSRQPFVLVEAHRRLATDYKGPGSYWRREDVWNDVKTVYEDCLAANPPTAQYERSGFALYACTAGQWKVADALFKELGGQPNLRAMGSIPLAEYKRLAARAATLAGMKPGQADALTARDEAFSGTPGGTVDGE